MNKKPSRLSRRLLPKRDRHARLLMLKTLSIWLRLDPKLSEPRLSRKLKLTRRSAKSRPIFKLKSLWKTLTQGLKLLKTSHRP